jgi:hypothetical protein
MNKEITLISNIKIPSLNLQASLYYSYYIETPFYFIIAHNSLKAYNKSVFILTSTMSE